MAMPTGPGDFSSVVAALVGNQGSSALAADNFEASGTLVNSAGVTSSFTLTCQKTLFRFERRVGGDTLTTLRRDRRSQTTRNGKLGNPVESPRSLSAMNLLPVFALVSFRDDPRFTGSVIETEGGMTGLRFIEGTPPGMKPPPFPQPKLSVTIGLDAAGRIESATYTQDRGTAPRVTYRYSYDTFVPGDPSLPGKVSCTAGSNLLWTATLSGTRKNIPIPVDFFQIVETHERIKKQ